MLILGVFSGSHDASACLFDGYRMLAAVAQERLTRIKADGGRWPSEAVDDVLAVAGAARRDVDAIALGRGMFPWRWFRHFHGGRWLEGRVREAVGRPKPKSMERELVRLGHADSAAIFDADRFRAEEGFRPAARVAFYNHHLAHALPALFHTDWDHALLYTADGGGDNVHTSRRVLADGRLATLYGGDEAFAGPLPVASLGLAYGFATQALGFRINRHEGKVTGLAALGRPILHERMAARFSVGEDGHVATDFADLRAMRAFMGGLAAQASREDMAASVQALLEETVLASVRRVLALTGARRLGLAGGVFANVRLNQRLAEETPVDEVFVYPAMSDAGLPAGGVLQFLLERDGLERWLASRWPLEHLYLGRDFGAEADRVLERTAGIARASADPAAAVPPLLAAGRIVGLFARGMEYGPRALGGRSILASPAEAAMTATLNRRLERSDFMPFAPVVAAEDADAVFDLPAALRQAARFMTATCRVRPAWRTRLPAVVHVDGTARPQVLAPGVNPVYAAILAGFKAATGLPALVNTSFNVHEEPIVHRPEEAARALLAGRIDALATERALYVRSGA